ncbi:30S ribosomal protein S21, chloroplastic [Lactuca sativa]|nr:30S ribosomal protein S21, chloroplastic [Lactuca sativa]
MAVSSSSSSSSSSSLLNSLSSLSLSSSSPTPTTISITPASSSSNAPSSKTLTIRQTLITPVNREVCPDLQTVMFPALAFSNTLCFKSAYNVQVIAYPDESEDSLIGRFRREVFRANIVQEAKRRRFFETNQEKRKRKIRDAARRRARRRSQPKAKKEEIPGKKAVNDEGDDNWGPIDGKIPYCP